MAPFVTRPSSFVLALLLLLASLCILPAQPDAPANRVLALMEKGSFVELPPGIFDGQTEGTVEAWVKLNGLQKHFQRLITCDKPGGKGGNNHKQHFALMTDRGATTLRFLIIDPKEGWKSASAKDALKVGEWMHVAAVVGSGGMHLYSKSRSR